MENEALTGAIIGAAMRVHTVLGPGFLESVYEKALAHELRKRGLRVELGKWLRVYYDEIMVGEFEADMLVEEIIMVENKAVRVIAPGHEVQLVNCLTATKLDVGLLLNFGAERLQFKRKARLYQPRTTAKKPRTGWQDGQDEHQRGDETSGSI